MPWGAVSRTYRLSAFAAALALTLGCFPAGGRSGSRNAPPKPDRPFCANDPTCPEIVIAGDPFSEPTVAPIELTGYGDPSIDFDPDTGMLWLTYSWLEILVEDETDPDTFDLGVRTHIAKSADHGDTWIFSHEVNLPEIEFHPDSGEPGWSVHEVSTIAREGPYDWQLLWFKYFTPLGRNMSVLQRTEFLFFRTDAIDPTELGAVSDMWARGESTSTGWEEAIGATTFNFTSIPEISGCVAFTEPELFVRNGATYLALQCALQRSTGSEFEPERIVLLEEIVGGYRYVSTLLTGADSDDFVVDFFGQPDLAVARDGTVLLLVTPTRVDDDPSKGGCIVFEFSDFESGILLRAGDGKLIPRTILTADGNGLGPGLCTYHAESNTGILLVIVTSEENGEHVVFSIRATGFHP